MTKRSTKLQKKPMLKYGIIILAILIGIFLIYSLVIYYKSGIKETGVAFCEKDDCFIAPGDMHAQVDIYVCGKYFNLPLDKGSTEGPHTHKERNLAHFEGKLPYDDVKKVVTNNTYLKLGTFFDAMGVNFSKICIGDKCTGDKCNGKIGKLKMQVNEQENFLFDDYIWKDKDQIVITFD